MSCLFRFQYISIKASVSGDILQEWNEIAHEATRFVEKNQNVFQLLQMSWFFKAPKDVSWSNLHNAIEDLENMKKLRPITQTFISQAPVGESKVELIIRYTNDTSDQLNVQFKKIDGNRYTCVTSGENRWIFVGGMGCYGEDLDVAGQIECVFSDLQVVLAQENLGFSQMVRQWNYIENIVGFSHQKEREYQHYQEFNEIRAKWYSGNGLTHDYPAATGIGSNGSGIVIEGVAAGLDSSYKLLSIGNPRQENAHSYSKAQLIGTQASSAPLFERGKMVFGNDEGYIWVSGTAAIRGENSVLGNISDQTRLTCENIDELISPENLHNAGLTTNDFVIKAVYIRAYVKPGQDGLLVRELVRQRYPDALVHVLYADICREELLVELEGEFLVSLISLGSLQQT